MSVVKGKRGESGMEFLHTARLLQIFTIQRCVTFPKRYTFYIGQPIAACGTRIHELVKCGNSVYPTNAHEVQIRRDYFIEALAETQNLVSLIEVANELFGINKELMGQWAALIDEETRLIKGVMERDMARFKNLP